VIAGRAFDRLIAFASPAAAYRRALRFSRDGDHVRAFDSFVRAARAGLAEAKYRVARCYLEGLAVPRSRTHGVHWLSQAATDGSVTAQLLLAVLHLNGQASGPDDAESDLLHDSLFGDSQSIQYGPPDFPAAARWAQKAAGTGSSEGEAILAYIHMNAPPPLRDLESAHRLYARSAAGGCAQGHLGYALSLATRPPHVDTKDLIVEHLTHAAEAGLPTAQYLLGTFIERGDHVPRDEQAALDLYRRAAEQGHGAAQCRLGRALLDGHGAAGSRAEAESWLRQAALGGNAEAATVLGEIHARAGDRPNYIEAAQWFRRAAEAGDAGAARALGSLHLTGAGVPQDEAEAVRWFRIASEAGDTAARVELGNLVLQRSAPSANEAPIGKWFADAASSQDLVSVYNLGVALATGTGVRRDERQAATLMRHAAKDIDEARYRLGRMLSEGRGVATNEAEARAWLAQAAQAGLHDAQVSLGEMLINGRGGPVDAATARHLFEKAAEAGHSGAMFALGALHTGSYTLSTDLDAAMSWFRAAAERGHGHAQLMVGRYYAHGIGVQRNHEQAVYWLELADSRGIAGARAELAALQGRSTRAN
jgi:TPR repeat protein